MGPVPPDSCPDVEALLARYESEPEHPRHVCRLALQVFDQPGPWRDVRSGDRRLLAFASLLHDIGWAVSAPEGRGHHKASARLIGEHPWRDLPPEEVVIVAAVARYHRKALPDPAHPELAAVPAAAHARVFRLAAVLRLADALDRRHLQRVARVTIREDAGGLSITAHGSWTVEEELDAAGKKADLLRTLVTGPVVITAEPELDRKPAG